MKPTFVDEAFQVEIRPGNTCTCMVEHYKCKDYNVIVCTELSSNKGASITNEAEKVATEVVSRLQLDPERLIWIEHYDWPGTETWDSCEFEWGQHVALNAKWFPISEPDFDALDFNTDLSLVSPAGRRAAALIVDGMLT